MSVKYTPRKVRTFRLHKQPAVGHRLNHRVRVGQQGIFAADYGQLNWRLIETGRRVLARQYRRGKIWIRITLTQPLTAKSSKARMGGGKGKFRGWTGYTRPGTLMYEMQSPARRALREQGSFHTRSSGILPLERIKQKFPFAIKVVRNAEEFQRWADYGHGPRQPLALRPISRERLAHRFVQGGLAATLRREGGQGIRLERAGAPIDWLSFMHSVWNSQRTWRSALRRRRAGRLNWIGAQARQRWKTFPRRRRLLGRRRQRSHWAALGGYYYSFLLLVHSFCQPRNHRRWSRWIAGRVRRKSRRQLALFRLSPKRWQRQTDRWESQLFRRMAFLDRLMRYHGPGRRARRRRLAVRRRRGFLTRTLRTRRRPAQPLTLRVRSSKPLLRKHRRQQLLGRVPLSRQATRLVRQRQRFWLRRKLITGALNPKRKKRKGDFWILELLHQEEEKLHYHTPRFRSRLVNYVSALTPLYRWKRWRRSWLSLRRNYDYPSQWTADYIPFLPAGNLKLRRHSNRGLPRYLDRRDMLRRRFADGRRRRRAVLVRSKVLFHL